MERGGELVIRVRFVCETRSVVFAIHVRDIVVRYVCAAAVSGCALHSGEVLVLLLLYVLRFLYYGVVVRRTMPALLLS